MNIKATHISGITKLSNINTAITFTEIEKKDKATLFFNFGKEW